VLKLLARTGHVTEAELQDKVWPGIHVAQSNTVKTTVSAVRKALKRAIAKATGERFCDDPVPLLDRGPGCTAWGLALPEN
jgi:hypothetical protein